METILAIGNGCSGTPAVAHRTKTARSLDASFLQLSPTRLCILSPLPASWRRRLTPVGEVNPDFVPRSNRTKRKPHSALPWASQGYYNQGLKFVFAIMLSGYLLKHILKELL